MKGVCCELHFLGFFYLLILTISSSMDDDERFLFGVIIVSLSSEVIFMVRLFNRRSMVAKSVINIFVFFFFVFCVIY